MITLPVLSDRLKIATDTHPLRASALPKLLECPGSVLLNSRFWVEGADDEGSGEAADTGNLVHSAAAAYHLSQGQPEAERESLGDVALDRDREKFRHGDPERASKIFRRYVQDKANQAADCVKVEQRIVCRIPPVPWDVTGQPIYVRGTLDQLRRLKSGDLSVYDIKTGKNYYGKKALDHYLTQQAAYTLGAIQTWKAEFPGVRIRPGALICTDGYFRPKGKAFWAHKWTEDDCLALLEPVAVQIAAARMGVICKQSGDHCHWCEHKEPAGCLHFTKNHLN